MKQVPELQDFIAGFAQANRQAVCGLSARRASRVGDLMVMSTPDTVASRSEASDIGAACHLVKQLCTSSEAKEFSMLPANRHLRWLRGRIAIKTAVQVGFRGHIARPLSAVDIDVFRDEHGAPHVRVDGVSQAVFVSLTHKDNLSIAFMSAQRAVGLDYETVKPRSAAFLKLAFTPAELQLLEHIASPERLAWYTRLWCAKEAVSKSLGTGLKGRPKSWVTTQIDGERLLCHNQWVTTQQTTSGILAWTYRTSVS